jgi:hypothetical protein
MDVGGDVYDFLELADGRLAVVLGDVTGHGIDAAADMAMAKFVFRSLAREHSEPSEFLAAANEIVLEEIGDGKFITMLYVTADGRDGGTWRVRAPVTRRLESCAPAPWSRSASAGSRSGSRATRSTRPSA